MNGEQVLLAAMGALLLVVIGCLGLVYRDRRRANRTLTEILASVKREVEL
jgi:signal transduction histidine kinase